MNTNLLLSAVRNGDFAHPGEIEAIDITMQKFAKNHNLTLLDVGCGLGGTAKYVEDSAWGNVICIDIEEQSIDYVKKTYPFISAYNCDVINAASIFNSNIFDIIYLFSSFHAFKNQQESLSVLFQLAKPQSHLVIFEYMAEKQYCEINPFGKSNAEFSPIRKDTIGQTLLNSGWKLTEILDLTTKYKQWYMNLLNQMLAKKQLLVDKFGSLLFNQTYYNFTTLLRLLNTGKLCGGVLFATKLTVNL